MKKIFTSMIIALAAMNANAQTESYTAVTADGMATEFSSIIDANGVATNAANGQSIVNKSTANVDMTAVGGSLPATVGSGQDINPDGTVNSWASITWGSKNQGDISFYYIAGTGVPYVVLTAKEIVTDSVRTGVYKADYAYYAPDGSKGLPLTGLYYKFTTKVAGKMKVGVWINKGNRNMFIVEESSKLPIAYKAEGYINGQNTTDATGTSVKKYLTPDQVDSIHKAAKVNATTGVDTAPYVVGAGNQNFWGYLTFNTEAGKTYWVFLESAQIGFQSYEFTPGGDSGVEDTTVDIPEENVPLFNLAGQQVNKSYKGIIVKKGNKFINR